ncbi:MAG: HD domain-containing protein [Elusimicrobiaceae bacterium]|nr:HD domain-containing protein [Elusimicrobiaceae bacterium]
MGLFNSPPWTGFKNPLPPEIYRQRTYPLQKDIRGDFYRDQTKIIHSLAFRRLKHKTQVFFAPENDHICTRIEHVLHVSSISATICHGINRFRPGSELDPDMASAIGLAHDLGHPPFGHDGEVALDAEVRRRDPRRAFLHEINGYRVVEKLANYGKGLNLTYAVKDGVICHNGENFEANRLRPAAVVNRLDEIKDRNCAPASFEGCVVKLSDKIAYLGRDIEDAIKAGLLKWEDIPKEIAGELGQSNGEIISALVEDLIENSTETGAIGFSDQKYGLVKSLGEFNYRNIYLSPELEDYTEYINNLVGTLFGYYMLRLEKFGTDPAAYQKSRRMTDVFFGDYLLGMRGFYESGGGDSIDIVTDYISGMTDAFALKCMKEICIPAPMKFTKSFS